MEERVEYELEGERTVLQLLVVHPGTGEVSLQKDFWNQLNLYSSGQKLKPTLERHWNSFEQIYA